MARKVKENLTYFSLDIDFFDDPKIMMIEESFGIKGSYIAIKLLTWIYRNGYYLEWDENIALLFAKRVGNGVNSSLVNDVVKGLIKCSFFNEGMFNRFRILTSKGIQERWQTYISNANRTAQLKPEYNLLNPKNRKSEEIPEKSEEIPEKSEEIKTAETNITSVAKDEKIVSEDQKTDCENLKFEETSKKSEEIPEKSEEIPEKSESMQRIEKKRKEEKRREEKEEKEREDSVFSFPAPLASVSGLETEFRKYIELRKKEKSKDIPPGIISDLIDSLLYLADPLEAIKKAITGRKDGGLYLSFFGTYKKPTMEDIEEFCIENNFGDFNCEKFFWHYDSIGWDKCGKWRSQIRKWNAENNERNKHNNKQEEEDDIEYEEINVAELIKNDPDFRKKYDPDYEE